MISFISGSMLMVVALGGTTLPPQMDLKLVEPQTSSGFGTSRVTDINDHGFAVGTLDHTSGGSTGPETFAWHYRSDPQPTLTAHGSFTNNRGDRIGSGATLGDLYFVNGVDATTHTIQPLPGHDYLVPSEISDAGVVIGSSARFSFGSLAAFAWSEQDGMIDLTTMVPLARDAVYASENGYIVGHRPATDGSPTLGYFLDMNTGDWVDLYAYFNPDAPAGIGSTEVRAVNQSGEVVGMTTYQNTLQAFIWSEAEGHEFIPNPFGGDQDRVLVNHINDAGIVVGQSLPAGGAWRAFAWSKDAGFINLASYANQSGYALAYATRINNLGEISGLAAPVTAPWSANRGFVLSVACQADLNGDGTLDFFDVSAFLGAFNGGDPSADLNGDGNLDFFDVSNFLGAYSAGCP